MKSVCQITLKKEKELKTQNKISLDYFAYMYISVPCVFLVPSENGREH